MAEKQYIGTFAGQEIQADSKKEYVFNALSALYEKNKNLSVEERLIAYSDFFANNFSYDKEFRNEVIAKKGMDTSVDIENQLFKLIKEGKGVCQQFTQAMTLLTQIDYDNSGNGIKLDYAVTDVVVEDKSVMHAFNVIRMNNKVALVIDLSSMIHSVERDYKQSSNAFFIKNSLDYSRNMKAEGVEIITTSKGKIFTYPRGENFDACYNTLISDQEIFGGAWLDFEKDDDIENSI